MRDGRSEQRGGRTSERDNEHVRERDTTSDSLREIITSERDNERERMRQ